MPPLRTARSAPPSTHNALPPRWFYRCAPATVPPPPPPPHHFYFVDATLPRRLYCSWTAWNSPAPAPPHTILPHPRADEPLVFTGARVSTLFTCGKTCLFNLIQRTRRAPFEGFRYCLLAVTKRAFTHAPTLCGLRHPTRTPPFAALRAPVCCGARFGTYAPVAGQKAHGSRCRRAGYASPRILPPVQVPFVYIMGSTTPFCTHHAQVPHCDLPWHGRLGAFIASCRSHALLLLHTPTFPPQGCTATLTFPLKPPYRTALAPRGALHASSSRLPYITPLPRGLPHATRAAPTPLRALPVLWFTFAFGTLPGSLVLPPVHLTHAQIL